MNYSLLLIGILLLVVAFLVGVKKQTWLLAGFNEKNIKNKDLLGKVVGGGFFLPLGIIIVASSVVELPNEFIVIAMLILLTLVYLFINRKLMD